MYQGTYNHLSADELNTFRIKYRHLKVVIIDEISMVGNMTLSFIDTRLQQLTGSKAAFGGLSVIAVGDLYQLKPVGDFYAPNFEKVGTYWFRLVRMYVCMYSCSRYRLETSCMDSSWKNSRRIFLVFPELSPLVKLRPFDKQGDEIL